MQSISHTSSALALLLGLAVSWHTLAEPGDNGFYDRGQEGWFWYKEEPEPREPKPEPEPEPEPEPVTIVAESAETTPEPAKPQGPAVFSAAWFRENLPKYRDKAWDKPTQENVSVYMYLQRYAMDRSEQFADATELAVVGNPFLDEESRRPSATFASQKLDRWAGQQKDRVTQKISKKAGLFFFYKSDSQASLAQAPIIKMLEMRDGFTVLPISMDGKPLPSGVFPNFRNNDGQAEKLGIQVYPAMFLVSDNREIEPIGQGILSLADIKHRIILVAKRRGWITEEDFNKTRPMMNLKNNIATILDEHSAELSSQVEETPTGPDQPPTNFVPPEQLGAFIRQKLKGNH